MIDGATLDLLPDPTVAVGADGTVVAVNTLAARLLERSEPVGCAAAEILPLTDEAGRDWWACTTPLARDPRLVPRVPEADLTLRTPSRDRPVTVTAHRVAGPDGATALLVLGLRRAERRARADALRSELVATMAHDLRSPLTSVRGFTRTLLARWERFTDEQRQQMLRTIDADADRVTRLLTELLDVSRIDAGRLRLAPQMVDLPALVERVTGAPVAAELPPLYADPDRLAQVLTTLVEQAEGPLTASAVAGPDAVEVTVGGLRGGLTFEKGAHGLSLYIAKGIVEAHGGTIRAEQGTVTFALPVGGKVPW